MMDFECRTGNRSISPRVINVLISWLVSAANNESLCMRRGNKPSWPDGPEKEVNIRKRTLIKKAQPLRFNLRITSLSRHYGGMERAGVRDQKNNGPRSPLKEMTDDIKSSSQREMTDDR